MKKQTKTYFTLNGFLLMLALIATQSLSAQINIGTQVADTNAILDLQNSLNKPFKISSSNNYNSIVNGMLYYNTQQGLLFYRDSGGFNALSPWKYNFNGAAGNHTYFNESGNVGIGLNDPLQKLHIKGSSGILALEGSLASVIELHTSGFSSTPSASIGFNADASTFRIKNNLGGGIEVNLDNGDMNVTGKILQNGYELLPSGAIMLWSGTSAPDGWVICDGSSYQNADGLPLNAPNLKGRFIVGYDPSDSDYDNPGTFSVGSSSTGDFGGQKKVALTIATMPNHSHSTTTNGSHYHTMTSYGVDGTSNSSDNDTDDLCIFREESTIFYSFKSTNNAGNHSHSIEPVGSGEAHQNLPPYYTLMYIIKK